MNKPHNPSGKGLNSSYELDEEGLSLAQQIMKFNLLVMSTFNGKADSPEELANRFTTYFEMCLEHGRIPTVERSCSCFSVMLEVRFMRFLRAFLDLTLRTL